MALLAHFAVRTNRDLAQLTAMYEALSEVKKLAFQGLVRRLERWAWLGPLQSERGDGASRDPVGLLLFVGTGDPALASRRDSVFMSVLA